MKIYVASSWRNEHQPSVVTMLREIGHEVYDFRNPFHGNTGFAWSDIDPDWENWTTEQYREALKHPIAIDGFKSDFDAMNWADACVLVLPCGRSANAEAGWLKGAGKLVWVYSPEPQEPELMYKMYDGVIANATELVTQFRNPRLNAEKVALNKWPAGVNGARGDINAIKRNTFMEGFDFAHNINGQVCKSNSDEVQRSMAKPPSQNPRYE